MRSIDFSPIDSNVLYLQPNAILTSPSGRLQAEGPLCSESFPGPGHVQCLRSGVCLRHQRERAAREARDGI